MVSSAFVASSLRGQCITDPSSSGLSVGPAFWLQLPPLAVCVF